MTDPMAIVADLKGKAMLIAGASAATARVAVHYNVSREAAEVVVEDLRQGGGEALLLQAEVNAPEAAHIRETNAEN